MPCYKVLLDKNKRILRKQLHLLSILFESVKQKRPYGD